MGVVTKSTSSEFLVHYSPSDGHRQTKCDELISGWGKAAIKAAIQYPKTPTAHSPRQWGSGRRMWQPPPLRWKCVRNAAAGAAAFVRDLPRNHVNNLSSAYIVVVPVVELFLKTSRGKRAFFTFPAKFPYVMRSFLCLHNTGPLMTHWHMVTRRPPTTVTATSSTAQQPSDSKSTRLATSPQNLVPAAR